MEIAYLGHSSFKLKGRGASVITDPFGPSTGLKFPKVEADICHLGDLGQASFTSAQLEEIGQVDILLIPVGGTFTIDPAEAAKITASLEPKIVIPMHYFNPALKTKLEEAGKFLEEMGKENLAPQQKVVITKDKLPEETE